MIITKNKWLIIGLVVIALLAVWYFAFAQNNTSNDAVMEEEGVVEEETMTEEETDGEAMMEEEGVVEDNTDGDGMMEKDY